MNKNLNLTELESVTIDILNELNKEIEEILEKSITKDYISDNIKFLITIFFSKEVERFIVNFSDNIDEELRPYNYNRMSTIYYKNFMIKLLENDYFRGIFNDFDIEDLDSEFEYILYYLNYIDKLNSDTTIYKAYNDKYCITVSEVKKFQEKVIQDGNCGFIYDW